MATKKARKPKAPNVLRKVKIGDEWKFLPVVKTATGFVWRKVMLAGKPTDVAEGTFYLEYRENKKKRRRAVGEKPELVQAALVTQTAVIELRAKGVVVDDAPEVYERPLAEGKSIAEAVQDFCDKPPLGLRTRSIGKYKFELHTFEDWAKSCKKTHIAQLGRKDIKDFMVHLVRVEGLELKTAINKAVIVLKQMRDAGAAIEMQKGDWPQVTEEQPDVYTPEQLKPFFAACKQDDFVLFQTFLLTGFRDQEVGFLSIADFNHRASSLSVTKKAGFNFDPKNYMERTNPIPPMLVELLTKQIARLDDDAFLIFPTRKGFDKDGNRNGGRRDKHMLMRCKKIAWHAGLNCGRCHGMYMKKPACCSDKPICALWTLHKFRHTYATTLLHDPVHPVDLVTMQKLLGHKKIESTMKYVRSLPAAHIQEKMKNSALSTMFV